MKLLARRLRLLRLVVQVGRDAHDEGEHREESEGALHVGGHVVVGLHLEFAGGRLRVTPLLVGVSLAGRGEENLNVVGGGRGVHGDLKLVLGGGKLEALGKLLGGVGGLLALLVLLHLVLELAPGAVDDEAERLVVAELDGDGGADLGGRVGPSDGNMVDTSQELLLARRSESSVSCRQAHVQVFVKNEKRLRSKSLSSRF